MLGLNTHNSIHYSIEGVKYVLWHKRGGFKIHFIGGKIYVLRIFCRFFRMFWLRDIQFSSSTV
jgi:hypothetical protein